MDNSRMFLIGLIGFMIGAYVFIAWYAIQNEPIIMQPIKDNYRKEILYYIDTSTHKTYKLSGDVLYYYESEENYEEWIYCCTSYKER